MVAKTSAGAGDAPANPPKGGTSGEGPATVVSSGVKGAEDVAAMLDRFSGLLLNVERAVLAKAKNYTDNGVRLDQQRADRAHLLAGLMDVARAYQLAGTAEHPTEGLYLGEADIARAYRDRLQNHGIFLLPNVVWVNPIDASGNVVIEVEYAVADVEGRYWPAAIRVAGMGNDRVAQQRGGGGDKAMPRALSAAYKEAVCRLLGIPIERHDPEAHDMAHVPLPTPSPRPSNQQRGERPPSMTMAEEDEFRDKVLDGLSNAQTVGAIEKMFGRDDFKAKLKAVGSRTRKKIEDEAAECKRRLGGGGDDRRQDDRRDDRRQNDRQPDRGQGERNRDTDRAHDDDRTWRNDDRRDDDRGGRDDDRRSDTRYGLDPDDDIPF